MYYSQSYPTQCHHYLLKGAKEVLTIISKEKRAVTVLNHMLKSSWGEEGSGDIKKKLKYRSIAYL